ncbi:hypothetical protein [Amycolatopsis ultiminotia]
MTVQSDKPNEALKLFQLAQFNLTTQDSRHERTQVLNAWLDVDSAHALAMLDHPGRARDLISSAGNG